MNCTFLLYFRVVFYLVIMCVFRHCQSSCLKETNFLLFTQFKISLHYIHIFSVENHSVILIYWCYYFYTVSIYIFNYYLHLITTIVINRIISSKSVSVWMTIHNQIGSRRTWIHSTTNRVITRELKKEKRIINTNTRPNIQRHQETNHPYMRIIWKVTFVGL